MELVRHRMVVPADTSKLCDLRESLSLLCEQHGVPPKTVRRMVLAIDEALSNVIEHAHLREDDQAIELSIELCDDKIVAEICDNGIPFDPTPYNCQPDQRGFPRRGFGLYLIHMIVDSVDYQRTREGRNILTLTKGLD